MYAITSLLLLAALYSLSNGQHSEEPRLIDVQEDQHVRLHCRFDPTSDENLVYYWLRRNVKNVDNVAMHTTSLVDQYRLDVDLAKGRYDLIISAAAYSRDNGIFDCKIKRSNSGDSIYEISYQVTILILPGPPVIVPSQVVAREGEPFELNCSSVGGSPDPEIEWFRNGIPIASQLQKSGRKDTPTFSILKIMPTMADDQLPYTCRVHSRALGKEKSMESEIRLNVHYVPRVSVGPYNPLKVLRGDDAHLKCEFQANPHPRKITWYRDILPVHAGPNYTIPQVHAGDSRLYRCEVENDIHDSQGRPGWAEIQLSVLYPPVVTLPTLLEPSLNEPLQLHCDIDAQPLPHRIAWYRVADSNSLNAVSSGQLLGEEINLDINKLAPTDSGFYTCVVENRITLNDRSGVSIHTANATVEVRVQHAPTQVRISPQQPVAIAGRPFELNCAAEPSAYPAPKYRWWSEADELNTLSNHATFNMVTVHVRQEGRYFCQAENNLGKSEPASVQLLVHELPSITLPMKPEWSKKQGERGFSLTCRARGKPTPKVTWLHNGQPLNLEGNEETPMYRVDTDDKVDNLNSIQSILVFESSRRRNGNELVASDHGRYQCVFHNELSLEPARSETYLRIEHSPVLRHLHNRVAFDLNDSAVLRCEMSAYPKPTFEWYFENRLLEPRGNKYAMNSSELRDDVWLSTLVINPVTVADYGEYTCRSFNGVNNNEDKRTIIKLLERSEPEAPSQLNVLETGAEYAVLGWQAGFNGGYANTEFVVSYSSEDSRYSRWRNESCRSQNPCKLMGLRSRTNYAFRVLAVNRRGQSPLSEEVRAQTNVSIKDIPSPNDAVFDAHRQTVIFRLDPDRLPLMVRVEARLASPALLNPEINGSVTTMTVPQDINKSDWILVQEEPLKQDSEHVIYLPQTPQQIENSKQESPRPQASFAEMRISMCLQSNHSLCGYEHLVKLDYVNFTRENKVYTIDQLRLFISVGGCVALGAVLLLSIMCMRQRDRLAQKKKQEYDSESDSDSRSKVNTIGSNFFGAHDNKALVNNVDDPAKLMPPPMYSTTPNTPTASVNNTLNNNLILNGPPYGGPTYGSAAGYFMNGDPSPNSSNETAQSDLWVMKNDLVMPDSGTGYMQNDANNGYGVTPQHQSEMLMGGLSNSYHHLNQPNPNGYGMEYGVSYSYYTQTQPDETYPGMGEDAYTIKNSLYAPYYDESAYGTTKAHQPPPPPLPPMSMEGQLMGDYSMAQQLNQYHHMQPPQQQLAFDDETGYTSRQPAEANKIREIIV